MNILKYIFYISILLLSFPLLAAGGSPPPGSNFEPSIGNSIGVMVVYSFAAFMLIATGIRQAHIRNNSNYLWAAIFLLVMAISFIIFHFSVIYELTGIIRSSTQELTNDKIDTLYFSIVTWTTLGYGDFYPSENARIYASSQALLGYLYMGLLVSLIIHAFTIKRKNA